MSSVAPQGLSERWAYRNIGSAHDGLRGRRATRKQPPGTCGSAHAGGARLVTPGRAVSVARYGQVRQRPMMCASVGAAIGLKAGSQASGRRGGLLLVGIGCAGVSGRTVGWAGTSVPSPAVNVLKYLGAEPGIVIGVGLNRTARARSTGAVLALGASGPATRTCEDDAEDADAENAGAGRESLAPVGRRLPLRSRLTTIALVAGCVSGP